MFVSLTESFVGRRLAHLRSCVSCQKSVDGAHHYLLRSLNAEAESLVCSFKGLLTGDYAALKTEALAKPIAS